MAKGLGDMGNLMKQAQKMQADLKRLQADLKDRVLEGKAGGDAVVAYVNGAQELLQIKIKPDIIDPDDVEELEDLVVAAVRSALETARKMSEEETGRITGGMGGGLPF
ncbi:MAG: YbaB/EbfC family nucleoid-associated protein [Planctomycetota bacterium]|jgi:DNA-binding YbaB/EbfC family protein